MRRISKVSLIFLIMSLMIPIASSNAESASISNSPGVQSQLVRKSAPVTVKGKKYYVSEKQGDDQNPGTLDKPFRTISKAASIMVSGDACYIREGTYRETVKPSKSGTKSAPILFSSYNNEKVTMSGAEEIKQEWSQYKGNIYKTDLNWTMGKGKDQVFVDGEAVIQARFPNNDVRSQSPAAYSKLFPTRGYFSVDYDFSTIINSPYLTQDEKDYWKGGIYVGGHNAVWSWQTAEIKGSKKGQLSVNNATSRWWFLISGHYSAEMSEGYIANTLKALDMEGEWHIENNTLYIWMPKSDNPAKHSVEVKKRTLAWDLSGKKNIYIFGIDVFASSITMAKSENCTLDRILASYTSHFTWFDDARDGFIDSNAVRSAESSPMNGQVGIYISGKNNSVINSTIRYSAGAGLYLAGYGTTIENNIIHDAGYACTYMGLIFADDEYGNIGNKDDVKLGRYTIRYNTLYNTGRAAISFGGLTDALSYYAGSEISYNQIFNTMLFTSDGGAFYAYKVNFSADGQRTQLHHNLFWNSFRKSGGGVIYSDNMSEGLDVSDNVMWRHPYADKTFLSLKTDSPHKDNLPRDAGGNKFLGIREILPGDLADEDYAGGKPYATGAKHSEIPTVGSLPVLPLAAKYVQPSDPLPRTNWRASASSSFDEDTAPEYAIDDDDTYTYWRIESNAQGPEDWFKIDLRTAQKFSRIIMKCSGVKSPRAYIVTVSNDGKNWSEPVGMGDSTQDVLDIRLFSEQKARYVKIAQSERTTPEWGQYWMIQDLKIYKK